MGRTIHRWLFLVPIVACSIFLFAASPALADDDVSQGIVVNGNGAVMGKPSAIEIEATVSGDGELASDARVKFQDTKKKALAALDALKSPDLSVESEGPSIIQASDPQAQMRMMQGQGGPAVKPKVQISEKLKIVLKGVDKLEPDKVLETVLKLIDTCHDAGLEIGPSGAANFIQMQMRARSGEGESLVSFKIPDKTDLENQAYANAVADARVKAERIATLNGVKLGRVLAVQDQGLAAPNASNPMQLVADMITDTIPSAGGDPTGKEVSSDSLSDIPVSVHLIVKFEIAK